MKNILKFCFGFSLIISSLFVLNVNSADAASKTASFVKGQYQVRSASVDVNSITKGLSIIGTNRSSNDFHISLIKDGTIIDGFNAPGNMFYDRYYLSTLSATPGNYYLLLTCPSENCVGGSTTISSF
ncbi:hypothetical protein JFL43_22125 [Viridibacillus sp. YIM B01967]|uniref:Secreted protein n=1 Tax=Viridibacillus soli TaxID=2798301 RepID=A0ABS1HDH0_9BACL|nr:hypothetical protein [Viridibacillus soli]MBK3497455.1 hypothetical protein [Viridibacillus soli]